MHQMHAWFDPFPSRTAKATEHATSTALLVMLYTGSVDYEGEQTLMAALLSGLGAMTALAKYGDTLLQCGTKVASLCCGGRREYDSLGDESMEAGGDSAGGGGGGGGGGSDEGSFGGGLRGLASLGA
jgi:hypothetical protein